MHATNRQLMAVCAENNININMKVRIGIIAIIASHSNNHQKLCQLNNAKIVASKLNRFLFRSTSGFYLCIIVSKLCVCRIFSWR